MRPPKLRGLIREKYCTQAAFAHAMGMHSATLSAKLRGVSDFSRSEIEKSCRLLDIPATQLGDYFFTH